MLQTVFEDLLASYRRKSPDAVADCYSQDAELRDLMAMLFVPGSSGVLRGRKEIAQYYQAIFRPMPHNPSPQILRTIPARPHLIVETDEDRVRRCHVMEIRNDKILTHSIYLGTLPSRYVWDKLGSLL